MSNNKMLIDATHPEETRVVVLRGGRVEEFDYESAARKLLRGNIYLAKVTRVEPSLQAAFVEYGGNRHGFLAFNEIHPDYYQIPMADRQALIDEEAQAEAEEEAAADARAEAVARRRKPQRPRGDDRRRGHDRGGERMRDDADRPNSDDADDMTAVGDDTADNGSSSYAENAGLVEIALSEMPPPETVGGFGQSAETDDHPDDRGHDDDRAEDASDHDHGDGNADDHGHDHHDHEHDDHEASARDDRGGERNGSDVEPSDDRGNDDDQDEPGSVQDVAANGESAEVEQVGTEDALDEFASRPRPRRRTRSYKIQEVIKRRQVILVQVVKEERGTKGAALTTYLSLAGRYTVLMPNTARGGGISRKINNPQDRKRLKAIAQELEVPEGMGLIIRTAGAARTSQEIKRDFEYLLRLWESVREMTLQSEAPSLVYEEGNLIKRSIRDLYNKDVDEIIVAGAEAHRDARDFMRMLMPSHAKNVIEYQAPEPLFTKFGIERQLNAMFSPYVTLRSGGYLVINQTEALVAVDVNSGKSTREFSIEETALNTNLEASDEIARQVKLRDLAGLIVIDFIDMEEKRNNRSVERRLKDALRFDRARIQLGRISHFGLMEMSRQRLRTGVLEGSTTQCPHCQGTGIIRSTESVALAVLRGLEDAVTAGARTPLIATTTPTVALYILNNKRGFIIDMEARLGMPVTVQGSDKLQGANYMIEKGAALIATPLRRTDRNAVNMDWGFDGDEDAPEAMQAPIEDVDSDDADDRIEQPRHSGRDRGDRGRSGGRENREPREPREPQFAGEDRGEDDREGVSAEDGGRRRKRRRRRGGRRGDRFEGDAMRASPEGSDTSTDAAGGDDDDLPMAAGNDRAAFTANDDDSGVIEINGHDANEDDDSTEPGERADGEGGNRAEGEGRRRGRRRGRRGGRRNRERGENSPAPGLEPQPFIGDAETAPFVADHDADQHTLRADDDGGERPAAIVKPQRGAPATSHDQPLPVSVAADPVETAQPQSPAPVAAPAPAAPIIAPAPIGETPSGQHAEIPRHRQRAMTEPGQPKIERVVVRSDASVDTTPEAEAERPARKGWWSRRFGGE